MTTVKADGEVAPYEDMENATLLQKECYDLDEDTMIEITTYEKIVIILTICELVIKILELVR